MNRLTKFIIATFTVFLTACATTDRDIPSMTHMLADTTGQNGRACVRQSDIRGYGVLKNNVISIDGRRKYYLATVLPGCPTLATSARAMFASRFHELCGQSMGKIHTRDEHCTINQVFEFDSREEAFEVYHSVLERREELRKQADEIE